MLLSSLPPPGGRTIEGAAACASQWCGGSLFEQSQGLPDLLQGALFQRPGVLEASDLFAADAPFGEICGLT